MNSDVDDTEKYLTKSSKNRTSNKLTEKLRQQVIMFIHCGTNIM